MEYRFIPKMKIPWCFLVLLAIWAVVIEGQSDTGTGGFISIDCGAKSGSSYEDKTGIVYDSDDSYIDTGEIHHVDKNYLSPSDELGSTLRSFPNETRNCYTVRNVTKDQKYLLRAKFLYGNYDGKQTAQISAPLQFDLYIDITFWQRVNITDAGMEYAHEVVTVVAHDFICLCLVKISAGTPFISALELRPLTSNLYPYAFRNQSNAILFRLNYGPTKDEDIRYPDDPYDRIWRRYQYDTTILTSINTTENITSYNDQYFEAPISVLQTALTPISPNLTTSSYDTPSNYDNFPGYYTVLYMVELHNLSGNQSRQYDIYINDFSWYTDYKPEYLMAGYIYDTGPQSYSYTVFTLIQLNNSTLPPILNAMEVYWPISMEVQQLTSDSDVRAIMAVKAYYKIVRNWNGDPCSPTNFSWHGVNCTNEPPQITSLNLSFSGLSGKISDSFAKLQSIAYLDLSHNNLSGDIPDSLAMMSTLQVLNLSANQLNGRVPDALIKKNNSGLLLLLVDSCTNCESKSKTSTNTNTSTVIIATVTAVVAIVAAIVVLLILWMLTRKRRRRARGRGQEGSVEQHVETQVHTETKIFTHEDLKDITNNFSRTIGRGGFGTVYHGYLKNKTEVAVKVCSQELGHGNKQFLAEVRSLSLVHHRNIVTLVGYCKDGVKLAVVYEYMPQGSLLDHLRGKDITSTPLNWRMRLNIMLEAAQGLDYLHTGCRMVHRDVKSSNILLGQNFEAKVSDLGLARMFSADATSSLITLSGTPGYIDPEYQRSLTLNEKSDVYSFGVTLLEVVTGELPILNARENIHIVKHVEQKLARGSIEDMVDSSLEGEYDMNSMWKVVELAIRCTREDSANRPAMADVAMHLKDSVQMEEHHQKRKWQPSDNSEMNTSSTMSSLNFTGSFAPASR